MISCGDQSTNSIGHIDRCLDFNGRKIKSGDLVRHRYMCDNHLSTHLLRRNDIGITWKRGDVGIVLDTGHNHRRLGIPLARILISSGIGYVVADKLEMLDDQI